MIDAFRSCLSARQLVSMCSPVDLRFNSRTLSLVSVIYLWQIPWNTLNQKQSVISKAGNCGSFHCTTAGWPWTVTDTASLSMKEWGALIYSWLLSFPRWPEVKGGCEGAFREKEGNTLRSERGVGIVCVINESVVPKLSFNVSAPSKNISFRALRLGLRFMRPNLQAMCAWIKGTWDCLFMSDPGKFPVSCLSEALAKSMMGRWSPSVPW